jgi:hypothetical protein
LRNLIGNESKNGTVPALVLVLVLVLVPVLVLLRSKLNKWE